MKASREKVTELLFWEWTGIFVGYGNTMFSHADVLYWTELLRLVANFEFIHTWAGITGYRFKSWNFAHGPSLSS